MTRIDRLLATGLRLPSPLSTRNLQLETLEIVGESLPLSDEFLIELEESLLLSSKCWTALKESLILSGECLR